MKDNWIAVARAFKCFQHSTKATAIALAFLVCAFLFLCLATTTGSGVYLALAPAIGVAIVGFGYSIAGRLLLLNVPNVVPNARFYSLGSFTLEMLCLSSLGGYMAVLWGGIAIDRPLAIAWMAVSAVVGIVGMGFFLRFVHLIVMHFGRTDLRDELRAVRTQLIALLAFFVIAAVISRRQMPENLLLAGLFLIFALVILGSSISKYQQVLKSLRFSALREAAWCERDGVESE